MIRSISALAHIGGDMPRRLWIAMAAVIAGCSGAKEPELSPVEQATPLGMREESSLGFSLADALPAALSPAVLLWGPPSPGFEFEPGEGDTEVEQWVDVGASSRIEEVDPCPSAAGRLSGNVSPDCRVRLRADATLRLKTTDGFLDDAFVGQLLIFDVDVWEFSGAVSQVKQGEFRVIKSPRGNQSFAVHVAGGRGSIEGTFGVVVSDWQEGRESGSGTSTGAVAAEWAVEPEGV